MSEILNKLFDDLIKIENKNKQDIFRIGKKILENINPDENPDIKTYLTDIVKERLRWVIYETNIDIFSSHNNILNQDKINILSFVKIYYGYQYTLSLFPENFYSEMAINDLRKTLNPKLHFY